MYLFVIQNTNKYIWTDQSAAQLDLDRLQASSPVLFLSGTTRRLQLFLLRRQRDTDEFWGEDDEKRSKEEQGEQEEGWHWIKWDSALTSFFASSAVTFSCKWKRNLIIASNNVQQKKGCSLRSDRLIAMVIKLQRNLPVQPDNASSEIIEHSTVF